ncbi:MAG: DUF4332 domain-containing protein [Phycisphaeraceae bacterium]|nr:DUF4332 domain-containing protein [Phycisphaeraceae bacterium]
MANYKIEDIEGIGATYGEQLRAAGINDTDGLLEAGKSPKGRQQIEEKTGIGHAHILKWVNMADLYRINGVGSEFSELLEASGVDTVKELKHRVPANLAAKMAEVNAAKNLTRTVPSESVVAGWIEQAKTLPAVVEY